MKKWIAALLTCTLTAVLLAGCGSASDSGSASENGSNTSDISSAADSESTDADDKASGSTDTDSGQADSNADADTAEFTTVDEGVLTMATNAYFPPYEYYEGSEIVGIDVEIAQAIAEKLGLELKIEDMEFDSIVIAVAQGKADIGLAGMTVTDERKESVNFTDSYQTGIQAVIVTEDSEITSIEDLEGKKVGVQLGTTGDSKAKEILGDESVEEYNKGADAVMALKQGKIDAVIIDNQPAASYIKTTDGLKILDTEFAIEDYAAAVAKENTGLVTAFNNALEELKADGTIQTIIDKYITAD